MMHVVLLSPDDLIKTMLSFPGCQLDSPKARKLRALRLEIV